eukprot:scaffold8019_cov33-Tisochrysis_lutea.AAC.1
MPLSQENYKLLSCTPRPQSYMNMRDAISRTIQSTPSISPFPVYAEHAPMRQCRVVTLSSSSTSRISSDVRAPSMSCLLAKTSRDAPASLCNVRGHDGFQHARCCPHTDPICKLAQKYTLAVHTMKVVQPRSVRRINDPNQPIGLLKIIAPIRSERSLAPNIPDIELEPAIPVTGHGITSDKMRQWREQPVRSIQTHCGTVGAAATAGGARTPAS